MSVSSTWGRHEVCHNAKNFQRVGIGNNNGIGRIHRLKYRPLGRQQKALNRKIAVKFCNNDITVLWLKRAVHNQQITIIKSNALHAVALRAQEEGACPVSDKMLVEVQLLLSIVLAG